ncbi:MAG TPA: helicase [Myxococcales bacterium]|nr:helicase [Myxococcales bacterium]
MLSLSFHAGTLELRGGVLPQSAELGLVPDPRSGCLRAPARYYATILTALHRGDAPYEDQAKAYGELPHGLQVRRSLRSYQEEALEAWEQQQSRGVVVLPTGSGKTLVGMEAIHAKNRSALVVVPTLDLMRQWSDRLRLHFKQPIGLVGGGSHQVEPITVTTYDSAYLHMDYLGNRFGLILFDEVHHLPGASYALAAESALAPFRLGLTATPERDDGREHLTDELVRPVCYAQHVDQLAGNFLADYDVERITVELSPQERSAYEAARSLYTDFLRQQGIRMSSGKGWSDFIMRSARSEAGRQAMAGYQEQRRLAFAAPSKLEVVDDLLHRHRRDQTLLFTQDNATAYRISKRFLVPVITHQTKVAERSEILDRFRQNELGVLATSRVLNEGVDVPAARVAIVVSGSGSVREHVQRLGRILRPDGDKRAVLYELVAGNTGEARTSERRRRHRAYR